MPSSSRKPQPTRHVVLPPAGPPASQRGVRYPDLPFMGQQPPPCHLEPEGGWTVAGTFVSFRCGYGLSFWGQHQFNFLTLVEVQPDVEFIHARPEPIEWTDGDTRREHVPDFLVRTRTGATMFDIEEYPKRIPAREPRTRQLARSLRLRGIGYRMLPAGPFGAQPRLDNAMLVNSFGHCRLDEAFVDEVRFGVPETGASATQLGGQFSEDPRLVLAAALHLVWRGELMVDVAHPVDTHSLLKRARP